MALAPPHFERRFFPHPPHPPLRLSLCLMKRSCYYLLCLMRTTQHRLPTSRWSPSDGRLGQKQRDASSMSRHSPYATADDFACPIDYATEPNQLLSVLNDIRTALNGTDQAFDIIDEVNLLTNILSSTEEFLGAGEVISFLHSVERAEVGSTLLPIVHLAPWVGPDVQSTMQLLQDNAKVRCHSSPSCGWFHSRKCQTPQAESCSFTSYNTPDSPPLWCMSAVRSPIFQQKSKYMCHRMRWNRRNLRMIWRWSGQSSHFAPSDLDPHSLVSRFRSHESFSTPASQIRPSGVSSCFAL